MTIASSSGVGPRASASDTIPSIADSGSSREAAERRLQDVLRIDAPGKLGRQPGTDQGKQPIRIALDDFPRRLLVAAPPPLDQVPRQDAGLRVRIDGRTADNLRS
jgi:hypothetical protein